MEKIQEEDNTSAYLTDPELAKKIKLAEKELDKDEEGQTRSRGRARYRSRSPRRRSGSRTRSEKDKGAAGVRMDGFQCHWCGKQGHS